MLLHTQAMKSWLHQTVVTLKSLGRSFVGFIFFFVFLFLNFSIAVSLTRAEGNAPSLANPVVQSPAVGMWISQSDLADLPMSGGAWNNLLDAADENVGAPDLSDQDDDVNTIILAKALVFARTGHASYRQDVVDALEVVAMDDTEKDGRTLALGRNLVAYVIAADLIDLPGYDSSLNQEFRAKLKDMLTMDLDGRSLTETHEVRPNNWGTHAGASRLAVALYLGDNQEVERVAQVFKGWLGDWDSYHDFNYGDLSWQCNRDRPVGINPKGCTKEGHVIDGAQAEEMRRGGSFDWPPGETGYPWEALQGSLVTAELLNRVGYDTWEWEDNALLRSVEFLYSIDWDADGDDQWQVWIINDVYGTNYSTDESAKPGKNMGWTSWTHGEGGGTDDPPPPPPSQPTPPPSQPSFNNHFYLPLVRSN